ncbi:MAG TPA: hypothetical protein VF481_10220 [Novosphingobium sp.]
MTDTPRQNSTAGEQFSPGDFYEDVYYHPCIALGVNYDHDEIWGISLIDGSYPRCMSIVGSNIQKISLNEAWEMKQRHIRRNGQGEWWAAE